MGEGFFFPTPGNGKYTKNGEPSLELLHRNGCNLCPLNFAPGLRNPHMPAYGTDEPKIYIIGEAPGAEEDKAGIPFVGPAGQVLHFRIPEEIEPFLRWNNVVRTRPPGNRDPSWVETECCRPSIVRDIEETKPPAIFAFGNVPLKWLIDKPRITNWRGRRVPVKVGGHVCWAYFFFHPSYVLRSRRFDPDTTAEFGSQEEFAFACDLDRAFQEVFNGTLPEPKIDSTDDIMEGVSWVTGHNGKHDLNRVLDFLEWAAHQQLIALDYETNAIRPYKKGAKILSVSLSGKHETLAFPLYHKQAGWSDKELEYVEEAYYRFLYSEKCRKVAHMLSFEMEWSAYFYGEGCLRAGPWGDTVTQAYTLDERNGTHSLDFLCLQYFGIHLKALSKLDKNRLADTPLEEVLRYNGPDSKYCRKLFVVQQQRILDEGLQPVYQHMLRRVPTMVLTQLKGVPVHQPTVQKLHKQYLTEIEGIEEQIADLPIVKKFKTQKGYEYRPSAPFDIRYVLSKMLGKVLEEGVTEAALTKFDLPIVKLTLKWRKANKNLSTYVKPLMPDSPVLYPDGRLHPTIKTTDTDTTRTSSDAPNIQNFPQRKTREVRSQVRDDT